MAPSETDLYRILGLARHSTDDEIKKAFRKLARDTHPDKNPGDPTAKERFQDLQSAYDTLKDDLERSKYDEDNPQHGKPAGPSFRTPNGKSGTAKRYATQTPGWTTGTARGYDGFAQQASGKPKPTWAYSAYEEPSYQGYSTGGYRSRTSAEYEDAYSSKKSSSAYSRTAHPTSTNKYPTSSGSSASPRPKSTSGTNPHSSSSNRYAGESSSTPAGFNVADYIREKKAKDAEEKRRQDIEEQKIRDEARQRRDEEDQRRQEEERHRKAKEERNQERRRAEEAVRNPYAHTNGYSSGGRSTPTPASGYGYKYPSESPSPYTSRKEEDDLSREADEMLKERSKSTKPHLSGHSRRSSRTHLKPEPRPATSQWPKGHPLYPNYRIPEDWKKDKNVPDDIDVVEATPTESHSEYSSSDYFSKGNSGFVRQDGAGVYPPPPFSFNVPPKDKSTPTKNDSEQTMPGAFTTSTSSTKTKETSSHEPAEKYQDTEDATPNVFAYQESGPNLERKPTFESNFSFANGSFAAFTSNPSPEPKVEKEKSSSAEPSVPQRPKSQPTQTQPSFVPPPSAPPNLQQQQKAERQYKADSKAGTPSSTFNRRDLVENLLKSTAGSFAYQQPITKSTAPRVRKKSVTPLFGKKPPTVHRTSSKEAKLDTQPTVESDTEPDEPSEPAKKPPTAAANPPAFDYEPMDAEPTGTPKTMPTSTPATAIPNGVPKKRSSLDMSGLSAAIPPLSRSPADVGLAEFETLKSSLPPLQPTSPKSPLSNQFRTLRMNKRPANIPYIPKNDPFVFRMPTEFWKFPQTPGPDAPFEVPKPPPVPKTPQGEDVNLDDYNRFYHTLGPYIEAWNRYEAEVHALRADLKSRTMQVSSTQTLDTVDIVKYMDRVKKKDTVLDQSFTKARDKHLKGLDKWVKLRVRVLEDIGQQQQH